jgi:hypothetical protein
MISVDLGLIKSLSSSPPAIQVVRTQPGSGASRDGGTLSKSNLPGANREASTSCKPAGHSVGASATRIETSR